MYGGGAVTLGLVCLAKVNGILLEYMGLDESFNIPGRFNENNGVSITNFKMGRL